MDHLRVVDRLQLRHPALANQLNAVKFLGFPLGFYMAAQGSLIAFVVLCTWNAIAQNKIDEEFGVQED